MITRHLRAFAKINIDLRVLHQRPDGFHELRTIFQTISLADRMTLSYEPSAETQITIEGNVAIDDNLIERAARLALRESNNTGTFHFQLEKCIPMGAGLGGGSSDAAIALMAVDRLTGGKIAPGSLAGISASLGSDVPFFLHGGTAVGLGRGDELYPLPPLSPYRGLLVTPGIHVATADAYRALSSRLAGSEPSRKRREFEHLAWTEDLSLLRNDFEEAVFPLHPELAAIRNELAARGAVCARMTGSGSAIFGLFQNNQELENARTALEPYQVHRFSLVSREEYRAELNGMLAEERPA